MAAAALPADPALDLAELFRRHHLELVRLAVLLVRSQETAEDIVQDVFARIHGRPRRGLDPDGALAYLRQAVINGCRSAGRRQAVVHRARGLREFSSAETHESAEASALRSETRQTVLAALAALPLRRREVLVLRYYLGLSEAEIARTLGISAGAVKSAAARGITALAEALGEDS